MLQLLSHQMMAQQLPNWSRRHNCKACFLLYVEMQEEQLKAQGAFISAKKNIGDNRYFDKTIIAEKIIGEENR